MFLDEAIIDAKAGNGGRGAVSWRREKYIAKGGPDGGDGGRGGNIEVIADANTDTLSNFNSKKRFKADDGNIGSGSNKRGKDGADTVLIVPPGTTISERLEDGSFEILADLHHTGDRCVVAVGGRGGYGNAHFKSSTRQRPDFAELGEPGDEKTLKLELKLVADVGIIGYPSVGKSTLISVISAAKPKIADYPFTTLIPNLGVVAVNDRTYVVCDVPGLIEGASEGKGLGHSFLKHIERCAVLLHVLDISRALKEGNDIDVDQLIADYHAIRTELERYSPTLAAKREMIVLNKADLIGDSADKLIKDLKKKKIQVELAMSAATGKHVGDLISMLLPIVLEEREKRLKEEQEVPTDQPLPVLRPHDNQHKMGAYRIDKKQDGTVVVTGKRIEQFTVMTDFARRGALERFRDVLERTGVLRSIHKLRDGDSPVFIGSVQVDEYL